jgi:hypothetical protein
MGQIISEYIADNIHDVMAEDDNDTIHQNNHITHYDKPVLGKDYIIVNRFGRKQIITKVRLNINEFDLPIYWDPDCDFDSEINQVTNVIESIHSDTYYQNNNIQPTMPSGPNYFINRLIDQNDSYQYNNQLEINNINQLTSNYPVYNTVNSDYNHMINIPQTIPAALVIPAGNWIMNSKTGYKIRPHIVLIHITDHKFADTIKQLIMEFVKNNVTKESGRYMMSWDSNVVKMGKDSRFITGSFQLFHSDLYNYIKTVDNGIHGSLLSPYRDPYVNVFGDKTVPLYNSFNLLQIDTLYPKI